MSQPIEVDIPHQLGRAGARSRIEGGVGKLAGWFPGGAVVDHRWDGDSLHFTVQAMGQKVAARADLLDDRVHAVIELPMFLSMFADKIREKLRKDGPSLLR